MLLNMSSRNFLTRYSPIITVLCVLGILITAVLVVATFFFEIKGNGDSGIYHTRDCVSYSLTVIGNHPDDQWFVTEQQAINAGFRKALNCQ